MGDNIFFNNNIMGSGILTRQMLEENDVDPIGWPVEMLPKKMERSSYHAVIDAFQDGESLCWVKITDDDKGWVLVIEYNQKSKRWEKMQKHPGSISRSIATVTITNAEDDLDGIANVQVILRRGKLEWGMSVDRMGDGDKYIYNRVQMEQFGDDTVWGIYFESASQDCDGSRRDGWSAISYGGPGEDGLTSPEFYRT